MTLGERGGIQDVSSLWQLDHLTCATVQCSLCLGGRMERPEGFWARLESGEKIEIRKCTNET